MFPGLSRAGEEALRARKSRSGTHSKVLAGGGEIERLWRGFGIVSRIA